MTFLPDCAICAHRDFVAGFCSSPRISFPSNVKSTCRSPRFRSAPDRKAVRDLGVFREELSPHFDESFLKGECHGMPPTIMSPTHTFSVGCTCGSPSHCV